MAASERQGAMGWLAARSRSAWTRLPGEVGALGLFQEQGEGKALRLGDDFYGETLFFVVGNGAKFLQKMKCSFAHGFNVAPFGMVGKLGTAALWRPLKAGETAYSTNWIRGT
jgi:hypothetical protein